MSIVIQINKKKNCTLCWRLIFFCFALFLSQTAHAQANAEHISYSRIYDFLDELANDGIIELNSSIKPYSKNFIASKLQEAQKADSLLTKRQKGDLVFFMQNYALFYQNFPTSHLPLVQKNAWNVALVEPAVHYKDNLVSAKITPLLGMHIYSNRHGAITHRWFGADMYMNIGKNIAVYGSLRDNSYSGEYLSSLPVNAARLSQPAYLNDLPGVEYKEANYGGDFSDSRGGITLHNEWGSIGLIKDNVSWGDNYNGSNILSGRAPSFPMITMKLKPTSWFELNYIHGFLISNVLDSSYYYIEQHTIDGEKKQYRPMNKFVAANMLTFTPIPKLNISVGNAIVYAERSIQPAYLIPIAFYKSIDHLLTKGIKTENQNSQFFINVSSRNIKHLHLYGSMFVDEIKFSRFLPSNPETNPISYKGGFHLSNFPISNLSFTTEFTYSTMVNYKHSIESLTWASNSYNLGHYLGDNSQELFVSLQYKPIQKLSVQLAYIQALHGNEYPYIRRSVKEVISQPVLQDITWSNNRLISKASYELWNNAYAIASVEYNHAKGYNVTSTPIEAEIRKDAQGYLDMYSPTFYQGQNITYTIGFSLGF